jgi:hypothetical protein
MQSAIKMLLIIGGWLGAFVGVTALFQAATDGGGQMGPWGVAGYLSVVGALTLGAGLVASMITRMGHWSGAIVGAILAGVFLVVLSALALPLSRPPAVAACVLVGGLLLVPAWCGAWIGTRYFTRRAERT